MRCRFYENQFPEQDEVVVVNVTEIGEMGAYVTLLEYDDIEVTRMTSVATRRRLIHELMHLCSNHFSTFHRV